MDHLCYDILRIIFKYLSPTTLHVASLVCRYWEEVANETLYERGPSFFQLSSNVFCEAVTQFVDACVSTALKFQMFFVFNEMVQDYIRVCYCNYMVPKYYVLTIQLFMPLEYRACILNMSIPDFFRIEVKKFTFLNQPKLKKIYSPELNSDLGRDFEFFSLMRDDFAHYLDNNNSINSCMILFCDIDNINTLKTLTKTLEHWFPESKVSIWGGVTRKISFCKRTCTTYFCMQSAACVFIFIKNNNLKTWSVTWPSLYESEEIIQARFEQLKLKIQFKTYSLGFIYIAGIRRPDYFYIECDMFEKIFPKVPYIFLYGPTTLVGNDIKDFNQKNSNLGYLWENGPNVVGNSETSIMIITYN